MDSEAVESSSVDLLVVRERWGGEGLNQPAVCHSPALLLARITEEAHYN